MQKEPHLYLASQSPRRQELLRQLGIRFKVINVDIDETPLPDEDPYDYVIRLARAKALAGWQQQRGQGIPVLGSDTAVVVDSKILGKPSAVQQAEQMLSQLSGNTHEVMSAVALALDGAEATEPELLFCLNVSKVSFRELTTEEIRYYAASAESRDKAGAYAIQGQAAAFITHLSGSYSGVMGLPLYETAELLHQVGISMDSLVVS